MESNSRRVFLQVWEWRFCNSKNPIPEIGISNHNFFFFFLPSLPSLLHLLLIRATYFLMQIFILFIFTSITNLQNTIPNQSRVGVGGNGGWWVSKLLFGGDSGVCQFGNSNRQWWFQMPIWYRMWEEQFNPSPRFPNIWFFLIFNI